jgi:hypothetical protein
MTGYFCGHRICGPAVHNIPLKGSVLKGQGEQPPAACGKSGLFPKWSLLDSFLTSQLSTEAMLPVRPLSGQQATGTDLITGRIDFDEWVTLDANWHATAGKIMGPDAQKRSADNECQGDSPARFLSGPRSFGADYVRIRNLTKKLPAAWPRAGFNIKFIAARKAATRLYPPSSDNTLCGVLFAVARTLVPAWVRI